MALSTAQHAETMGTHSSTAVGIWATILLETWLSLGAREVRQSFCKLKCSSLPSCADTALQHYALLMVWTINLGIRAFASACSVYSINSFCIFCPRISTAYQKDYFFGKKIQRLRWLNCQTFSSLISHKSSKFISNFRYLLGTQLWME